MLRATLSSIVALVAVGFLLIAAPSASAQSLIGVNFTTAGSTTPDPQNWTRISQPSGSLSNLTDETGAATSVGVNFGGDATGGFVYLSTSTLAADAVPQYSYDLSGMTGYGFRSNGVFFTEFNGLSPNTPYEYWFVAYRTTSAIENRVTVSDGDLPGAMFSQSKPSGTSTARFVVNTMLSSNTQQFNDLSFITNSSSTGTLRFDWFGEGQTTVVGAIAIRVIPEPTALLGVAAAPVLLLRRRRR